MAAPANFIKKGHKMKTAAIMAAFVSVITELSKAAVLLAVAFALIHTVFALSGEGTGAREMCTDPDLQACVMGDER
jgi:hypothetical protein